MKLAQRMARLGTETAFEVLARAKQLEKKGRDIIHLEIGEPDFNTPENIVNTAIEALRNGYTHYVPAGGLPEVREIIAEEMNRTRGLSVGGNNVVVTPGGKPIIFFSILALINEGDEVIYPNPGFPIYESVIDFVGAKSIPIQLREENDFGIDIAELKSLVTEKTRMLILNSPQNPTGGVLTKQQLRQIAELAGENDFWVLTDEIYGRIIYDHQHESISQFDKSLERIIILDGLSKTYAMTGWRLGYGVMPEELAEQVTLLMINSNSCTAAFSQRAIIEAITGDQSGSKKMIAEFKRRRDIMVDGLNGIDGISCKLPRGAFYVFPNVQGTGIQAKKLADDLLNTAGVAVLSGTAFGKYGDGFLRLSYANSVENIEKALERISGYLLVR